MKVNGRELHLRPSNHKHWVLDDLDKLFEMLKVKSMSEVAKELNVPANSIRYRITRYLSDEQLAQIKQGRRFHQKNKTKQTEVQ